MTTPTTLAELIEALTELPGLDPLDRARRCPRLIDAAKTVLAQTGAQAMAEAVEGGLKKSEVARELGVSASFVGDRIKRHT